MEETTTIVTETTNDSLVMDELTESEVRLFVQENADYYLNKWKSTDKTKKARWNWAACWGSIFWLGYRKMYKPLIIVIIAIAATDGIELLLHFDSATSKVFDKLIGIVVYTILGIFGNNLYYNHVREKIQKIKATGSGENLEPLFKKYGGRSWKGVGISVLLLLGYVIIIALISE